MKMMMIMMKLPVLQGQQPTGQGLCGSGDETLKGRTSLNCHTVIIIFLITVIVITVIIIVVLA